MVRLIDPKLAERTARQAEQLRRRWSYSYSPCGAVDPQRPGMGCRLPLNHRSADHWASPDHHWLEQ